MEISMQMMLFSQAVCDPQQILRNSTIKPFQVIHTPLASVAQFDATVQRGKKV